MHFFHSFWPKLQKEVKSQENLKWSFCYSSDNNFHEKKQALYYSYKPYCMKFFDRPMISPQLIFDIWYSPQKGYTAKRLHPKNGIIWHGLIHAPKGSMDLFWRGTFQRGYFLQAKSKKASPKKATSQKGYYYQKASKFLEIDQYIRGI